MPNDLIKQFSQTADVARSSARKILNWLVSRYALVYDQNILGLISTVVILIAIGFWTSPISHAADFGLNAFTEILGVLFTVIVVNRIFQQRERRAKLPARILVYRECVAMTNRIYLFWHHIHHALAKETQINPDDILNQNSIAELAQRLDLTSKSPHTAGSWMEYFSNEISYISSLNHRIITQYANHLEPTQLQQVHDIATDSMFTAGTLAMMAEEWNKNKKTYSAKMPTYLSVYLEAPN